jgi:hypothetical protein
MSVQVLSLRGERATYDTCWCWTSTHSLHVTTIREVLFEVTALVLALESLRVAFGTLDAPSMVQTDLPVVHR